MATDHGSLAAGLDETARRLTERGLAGGRVEADRYVVALDDDNRTQAWITSDAQRQLLSVQVRSATRIAREAWPVVLRDLNTWNRDHRLTSAWLLVEDWELSSDAAVVVEAGLPVTSAHTPTQLADYVDVVLADGMRFWRVQPG